MNNLVEVTIEDPRWNAVDLPGLAENAARRVLERLGLDPAAYEVSILACDDARIAGLNAEFREKPTPTNVLSWPGVDLSAEAAGGDPYLDEAEPELGDIAIAWDTCTREATESGIAFRDHLSHLLIHGVLHLLGFDHVRDKDATLMEGHEVAILAEMGIADPYELIEMPQSGDGK